MARTVSSLSTIQVGIMDKEVKSHQDKIKNLKDEIRRLEFQLTMLQNNYNNIYQRNIFRRIAKEERKLSSNLQHLEEKAKEHGPTCKTFQEMIGIIENIKCASQLMSEDSDKLHKLWCFNGDLIMQERKINKDPTSIKEALDTLPKLGINWPPNATNNASYSNEVPLPIISFDGSSLFTTTMDSEQFKTALQTFHDTMQYQKRLIWDIGDAMNDLCNNLNPTNLSQIPQYRRIGHRLQKYNDTLKMMRDDIVKTLASFNCNDNHYQPDPPSTNYQGPKIESTQSGTQHSISLAPTNPRNRKAPGLMGDIMDAMDKTHSKMPRTTNS